MAGIVVLVVDDILTFGLMAGVVVLAVGDIHKLVTETIQFGLGSVQNIQNTITWYQLDTTQWTTISHLEQVSSGSVHAENWHVLGIQGVWGIGMVMRLHPWWVDSSPFISSSISMFAQCLWGCSTLYVWISNKMMHYVCQPNNQWGSSAGYKHQQLPRLYSILICTNFPTNVTSSNTF